MLCKVKGIVSTVYTTLQIYIIVECVLYAYIHNRHTHTHTCMSSAPPPPPFVPPVHLTPCTVLDTDNLHFFDEFLNFLVQADAPRR